MQSDLTSFHVWNNELAAAAEKLCAGMDDGAGYPKPVMVKAMTTWIETVVDRLVANPDEYAFDITWLSHAFDHALEAASLPLRGGPGAGRVDGVVVESSRGDRNVVVAVLVDDHASEVFRASLDEQFQTLPIGTRVRYTPEQRPVEDAGLPRWDGRPHWEVFAGQIEIMTAVAPAGEAVPA